MFKLLKKKKQSGFTLIELLVVVAVIGILASVILVGVAAFRGRGRDSRRIADLGQLRNALELCFTKAGSYPATLGEIVSPTGCGGGGIGVTQMPKDPSTQAEYAYCTTGAPTPNRYVLGATLEEDNPAIQAQNGAAFVCGTCTTNGAGKDYCVTI